MTKQEFIAIIAQYVKKYAPNYDIKVYSPIIAQACLESAYGTSELAVKANNYFGLKYNAQVSNKEAYIKVGSEQNPDGTYVSSVMKWCNFNNMENGVKGYFDFLFKRTGITRYNNLKNVTDPNVYINNIKADGYATSLTYVSSLTNVIKEWNLTQYDVKEDNNTMSESSLVTYRKLTNNKTTVANKKNNYIIPHVYVGQVTTVNGVNHFSTNCGASCQYVIGTDGTIGQCVSESDRSWCTGGDKTCCGYTGSKIDYESITYEMACDAKAPYAINANVRASLVKLMADCAKRNNMGELKWLANPNLVGQPDKQNVLVHRWFATKSCPGDYVYKSMGSIVDDANKINGYITNYKKYDTAQPAPAPTTNYSYTQFVKDVQAACGATVDGFAGPETLSKTVTISMKINKTHPVVKAVQKYLNFLGYNCGTADGVAGPLFDTALKNYQRQWTSKPDGEATARQLTWKKLLKLA